MLGNTTKTMRSTLESKLDGATSDAHIDSQAARERQREREPLADELWTLAVTQALVSELPRGLHFAPEAPHDAAEAAAQGAPDSLPPLARAGWEAAAARGALEHGAGENPATGAAGTGDAAADGVPAELCTEVSDERFGKLRLLVARGARGLDIVINVADSHVKALIEAEQAILMKTLKDAGLSVASVQIGSASRPGTLLAQDREGPGKARPNASIRQPVAKWRTYPGSSEEDAERDGVDLTA
jgi:hypothetical protein